MRVGLVTGEYPPKPGGVGDFTQALGCALAALGIEVHVLTSTAARGAPASANGMPVVHTEIGRWSWGSLLRLRGLARELRLDLLNVQYQAAAFGLAAPIHFLPQVAGVPVVTTFHDLRIPYLFPKAGRLRPAAVTHLARKSAGVIVTNAADEAELRRRGVARLAQIPIGSNIAPAPPAGYDRAAWRQHWGVQAGEFLLGYFGFLSPSKGSDTLISALSVLVHDRKARVKLVLIGASEPNDAANAAFAAQVEKQIKRYDLDDVILRTGFVSPPAVSGHLLACDAVVLPYRDGASWRRGSLLAALAHGCAVITTTPAEPLPALRDGDNIRLVPPDSAPALVLAVTELLHAPEVRAHMGAGARALAGEFAWDAIARRTLDFYRQR